MRLPLCLAIRSLSRNADDPARSGGVAALQRLIAPATTVARTWSQFSLGRLDAVEHLSSALELMTALAFSGRIREGLHVLKRTIDVVAPRDREVALGLEAALGGVIKVA